MRRLLCLLGFLSILNTCALHAEARCMEEPKVYNTGYAVLMDMESGRVLFEKNSRKMVPMASTTKIMTAIVALENSSFTDMVTVSKRASSISGSVIGLRNGEKVTMEELLYGLMLQSGNDCAIAIAEHIGGSVERFAYMMDSKAFDIGAFDTHFVTPHGLDREGHFTTAYDLSLITRYAMQNETFRRIVSTKSITIQGFEHKRTLNNINRLLWSVQGADGVKTGYTGRAGKCLVSSASLYGRSVICVTLSSPNRWEDSKNLLKYGLENFDYTLLLNPEDWQDSIPVANGVRSKLRTGIKAMVNVPVSDEEMDSISVVPMLYKDISAPVVQGQQVGELVVYSRGRRVYAVPIVSLENISKSNVKNRHNNK